ncbi:MAG: 16S rRNA (guanine(966)-N(2))-methyltransferase RsmD [Woeseiaceae bacterium]|nr:16S rRNA (guanine(966)-N(2))-methyltransferase RsmD [Woeseiaceae bacterium]
MRRTTATGKQRKGATSKRGRLRIVAGKWRSRVLDIADVPGLRPTSERVRETLFNWLTGDVARSRCLDLFAGTGALGLEALSRGAGSVVFVERDRAVLDALRQNIDRLDAAGAEAHAADARRFAADYDGPPFDIVFLDPPFGDADADELCRLLARGSLLAPEALVYLEQDRHEAEPALPDGWRVIRDNKAGNVRYRLIATRPAK